MAIDGKGYMLPDVIDPGEYKCIKVFIPNDPVYISAFWGAYEFFTTWLAWQRDADKRGRYAAGVWRVGFDAARFLWPDMEGCEMPFLLRDDPNDPCSVQQSLDGGTTWLHAFTKDCDEETGPITPSDNAAGGAGNFIFNLYLHIAELLDGAADEAEFITDYCAWMTTIGVTFDPGEYADCSEAAAGLWHSWDSVISPGDKVEMLDPCTYMPSFEEIQSCFNDAGVMDWLNCAAQTLGEWLNTANNDLMSTLNQVALAIAGDSPQNASDHEAVGGGAGFGGACEGEFECINFDQTPGGFVKVGAYGQWLDGVGWKAQIDNDNNYVCRIRKTSGFPGTTPGNIKVVYNPSGNGKLIELYVNDALVKSQAGGSAGYRELNYTPTGAITSVEILVKQNNLNSSLTITEFCITA